MKTRKLQVSQRHTMEATLTIQQDTLHAHLQPVEFEKLAPPAPTPRDTVIFSTFQAPTSKCESHPAFTPQVDADTQWCGLYDRVATGEKRDNDLNAWLDSSDTTYKADLDFDSFILGEIEMTQLPLKRTFQSVLAPKGKGHNMRVRNPIRFIHRTIATCLLFS
jgi:hypothetical protein